MLTWANGLMAKSIIRSNILNVKKMKDLKFVSTKNEYVFS